MTSFLFPPTWASEVCLENVFKNALRAYVPTRHPLPHEALRCSGTIGIGAEVCTPVNFL